MKHWLLVFIYIVPIIGSFLSMARRLRLLYSFGESLRSLFPDDKVYRRIRDWQKEVSDWFSSHSIRQRTHLERLNLLAGQFEYAFGHLRDYTIGLYMVGMAVYEIMLMVLGYETLYGTHISSVFYHSFFALLSLFTYRRHMATGLRIFEFLRVNPAVHPEEFFNHY
ncbi:MAG: hypothetical protein Q7S00_00100 [bacterium]|nr:hypothetical protein [bacterium]